MSLNYWESPQNPKLVRLYVSPVVFRQLPGVDSKTTKIWIEPSETLMAGWVIMAKGEVSLIGRGLAFQKRMMEVLEITPAMSWADLVGKANQPSGRKGQPASEPVPRRAPFEREPATSRAFEALKLDIPSIKMVAPVTIKVDHREPTELVQLLASHPMISVARKLV